MARTSKKPMAGLRATMRRIQSDGEELVGRLRRDAQDLLKQGRAEIAQDVHALTQRADRTLRRLETRVLQQLHAATSQQVKRLEGRLTKLERSIVDLERRFASTKTAA
jgi:uncharacterized protein involved in exopolysaccharide biosynthesis